MELDIRGLKCDNPNCDWSDMTIKVEDYKGHINRACPDCGENVLTQESFDNVQKIIEAIDIMKSLSEDEINELTNNLSEEEMNAALDTMNDLGITKISENEDGTETWDFKNV